MKSKFSNEISELLENQVISADTASRIDSYYNAKSGEKPNKLFMIFGILGSSLIGLGIILILAHNWDNFSKSIKTSLAFLPLILGQIVCGYSILKQKSAVWREASAVFLFFSVGACISLISQIYHIPGNLSGFLLTWLLLCVPLVYLAKSKAVAMLSIVFATYYSVEAGYSLIGSNATPWYYLLLFVSVIPFYIYCLRSHSKSNAVRILNWIVPLSLIIALGTFVEEQWHLGFLMYVLLFGFIYNVGTLPYFKNFKLRNNGFKVLGSLGTVVLLLTLSFKGFWQEFNHETYMYLSQEVFFVIILFTLSISALIYSVSKHGYTTLNFSNYIFIVFTFFFFIGLSNALIGMVSINIMLFLFGLGAIKRGVEEFDFRTSNYGLLIITALVACRFFDTDMSFVLRGILFLGVGTSFFLTNYYMLKNQNKIKTEKS